MTEYNTPQDPAGRSATRNSNDSVTLADVARLAGVSTITVSRALNYPDKVATKTLEKVNRAISQTGYVPNLLAGGLASRRTRLIAAIIPSITNLVYAETIQYFSNSLNESGYQVLLGESGYPEQSEQKLISTVLSRRPDGILLTGVNHSADCRRLLLAANIPLVETWDLTPTPLDTVVGFSHERIGVAVADFIASKGYQHVGTIIASDRRARFREKVMINRLEMHGIEDVLRSEVSVPTNLHRGRSGLASLLDKGFRHGVIWCSSDILAHGALIEAQSRGIKVPQELAIIGFGDQNFAVDTYPALTTVRIDRSRMGSIAANILLARIAQQELKEHVIDVGFEIIERETT
ncbi:LacI family DNA-binding transcriptional regulator [Gynuella sunshinyii]|uniref:Transcriptional regulator n=1 Tax=Gynuella sunshinyii YC6258 TaxID=1445510 RepID=A0A0C5V300_9GAMM|nr:LacI family DNA-binding transcriptional regulator [Gynuella sunshinyii]AJQ93900.1 transcriptional regulator [Gynuella sunshinyii YC6258]